VSASTDSTEWLNRFVVVDPPRGEQAVRLSQALVDELGSPQHHAPAVHIVGTAGKGSVAARLTGRLVGADLRVATHQSPHVQDVRERFLLDGELPSWDEVTAAIDEIDAALVSVRRAHGIAPTFFAVTAALSWVLGRRHDADVFVTEAGIGGRLDATSVLRRSDTLTVMTHIGLDHTEVLGSTVGEIAREKAAVMQGRRHAILGPQSSSVASDVVQEMAAAHRVELQVIGDVPGDWQVHADVVTDVAAEHLAELLGRPLPPAEPVALPGRMERRVIGGRTVVLDGAHSPMKLAALAGSIDDQRPTLVIAAINANKDLDGCGAELGRFGAPVITVEFGGQVGPRSQSAAALAGAVRRFGGRADEATSFDAAAAQAIAETAPGDTILVTGSFLILSKLAEALARASS